MAANTRSKTTAALTGGPARAARRLGPSLGGRAASISRLMPKPWGDVAVRCNIKLDFSFAIVNYIHFTRATSVSLTWALVGWTGG